MIEATKRRVEELYPGARVIYGDTDSVMVIFPVTTVAEAMKLGDEAAIEISKIFKKPIKLEFEKVYFPYLLMNKKRYAGMFFCSNPDKPDKMDTKGLETVRRDTCSLVRNMVSKSLWKLMNESDTAAIKYVQECISRLYRNEVDLSELVVTKELKKFAHEYKDPQAHAEVAEKKRKGTRVLPRR
eukprot:GFYU01053149.1.p1 GENE.GFYU01053149.1~~GFYU01053149.1.p1  ORF type:complete len:184 (-),score=31.09 GFYU01053149.1:478-1029(-)